MIPALVYHDVSYCKNTNFYIENALYYVKEHRQTVLNCFPKIEIATPLNFYSTNSTPETKLLLQYCGGHVKIYKM